MNARENPTSRNWSSRSLAGAWQHRFFYALIRMGGRRLAYAFTWPVVGWYMLLRPEIRRRSHPYLTRRFPDARGLRLWRLSFRLSLSFARVLVDRALIGILGHDAVRVHLEGREELLEIAREGGFILMNAHVGGWQVCMSSIDFLDTPVNMLIKREAGETDRHFFEHAGEGAPFRIIDPSGYLGGILEIMKVLKAGELLSVMGDRVFGSDRYTASVEFLGEPAPFPVSAYKIAAATGVPIVVFLSYKTAPDSYAMKLARVIRVPENPGRGPEALAPFAAQFVEELEAFVREHPFQFYNFFDMWA